MASPTSPSHQPLHTDLPVDTRRRIEVAQLQKLVWEQHRPPTISPDASPDAAQDNVGYAQDAVASARAKEIQIAKRKAEVQVKVNAHLCRLESEGRRLDELRRELEGLEDPTKKEVADIRKNIESVDRDLKPLKQLCERKEKELREAVQQLNEKNKLKSELVSQLIEIVTDSERRRMQKLDELNKHLEAMENEKNIAK